MASLAKTFALSILLGFCWIGGAVAAESETCAILRASLQDDFRADGKLNVRPSRTGAQGDGLSPRIFLAQVTGAPVRELNIPSSLTQERQKLYVDFLPLLPPVTLEELKDLYANAIAQPEELFEPDCDWARRLSMFENASYYESISAPIFSSDRKLALFVSSIREDRQGNGVMEWDNGGVICIVRKIDGVWGGPKKNPCAGIFFPSAQ